MANAIPVPSPQLAGEGFLLRPLGAGDREALSQFVRGAETGQEAAHLAIETDGGSVYLGEMLSAGFPNRVEVRAYA